MPFPRALAPLLVLLTLTACSGSEPTPDAGTQDSGIPQDAGTDAGTTDAGTDLAITSETLADGYVGQPYSASLAASGGVAPYTWSLAEGTPPAGLTLDAEGRLAGTPTSAATTAFSVSVRDGSGVSVRGQLTLAVYAPPMLAELPAATRLVGDDVSVQLGVSGGKAPITFASSGTLPPGLSLTQQGVLQGTLGQAGTFNFTVTATDANGMTASRPVAFPVQARFAITTSALPQGTRGEPYSVTLSAAEGRAPLSWSLGEGTLPAGLTLSSEGVLSGTPTAGGTASLTFTVRDADGKSASRPLSLSVREPGAPVFTVGQFNITYFGSDTLGPSRSASDGGTSDDLQIAHSRDIMRDAGANLWGMVEMVDTADFNVLKAQLPGFDGFLSNNAALVTGGSAHYGNSSQKLGVLYDSALTYQSAQVILTDVKADFGDRPPLRVDFTTEVQGVETPLVAIVVHMRAESADPTGPREARQRASAALKAYIDQNLATQHVLVLGDWNDDVDESITLDPVSGQPLATPYQNFVSDTENYAFITRPLSLAGEDTSIGFENVVDHTLATNELAARHVAGSARVLYVDNTIPDFLNTVSDHRPVISAYALSGETGPFLRLKSPQGGTYQSGSALLVTWTSFGVGTVRVEASTDNGGQWQVVAASVPAVEGRYAWTLPDIDSTTVRVRVVDVANPARSDTSDGALTLVRGSARVIINEVLADEPMVNGQNNPAYEFVELVNTSAFPVDLSNWSIWDTPDSNATANRRHVFASGTMLGAGKAIAVFGGSAGLPAGRPNAVASSTNSLGLNNGGDTVRLRRPDSSEADRVTFGATADNVSINRSPDATPDASFVLHNTLPNAFPFSPGQRADRTEF